MDESTALEQAIAEPIPKMRFNEAVHEADEHGDLIRNDDGSIRLKKQWKKSAVDRQGRTYNASVHGDEHELDSEGFLKVRRRDASTQDKNISRTKALVKKHQEPGYDYYIANDDAGNLARMQSIDWEPVLDGKGPVSLNVGQARSPNTRGVLYKKPTEWNKADQAKKVERNKARYAETTSPKEEDGQYRATETSPLR